MFAKILLRLVDFYNFKMRTLLLSVLCVFSVVFGFCSAEVFAADSKPFTVVIDAGHGGKDPGALGMEGKKIVLNEKDVNGKKRTPKVALAHELKHASDYDNGLATKEKTSNGISLMDVRAINFENKIRKITGDEKRIKYGGKNVPEELLD